MCAPPSHSGGFVNWELADSDATEYRVRAAVRHPAFNATMKRNDIALLFLDQCVELRDDVQPIKLAMAEGANWARTCHLTGLLAPTDTSLAWATSLHTLAWPTHVASSPLARAGVCPGQHVDGQRLGHHGADGG